MSARIYGLAAGEYLPQADFKVVATAQGGATASQSFWMLPASWETLRATGTFAKGVTATSLWDGAEALGGDSLYVDRVSTRILDGGYLVAQVFFAGWSAEYAEGEVTPGATYELRGTISEKPLEEHPQLLDATVNDTDRQLVRKIIDGDVDWNFSTNEVVLKNLPTFVYDDQPSAGIATTFCELAAKGYQSFFAPSFSWTKTWNDDKDIPNADLNNLGKVDVPDGTPPTAGGTRDWMLTSATSASAGDQHLYRNRLEWQMSDRGGWDADLYDY